MDEQRLQEIENSIGLIDCPECEMGRVSREGTFEDGQDYDRCETCDGSGMVSRFPEGHALIAEVRRLRQDRFHWTRHIADIADQRDAALAERNVAFDARDAAFARAESAERLLTEARRVLREVRPMLCDILKLTADVGAGNDYEAVARVIDQIDDCQRQAALGMGEGR